MAKRWDCVILISLEADSEEAVREFVESLSGSEQVKVVETSIQQLEEAL